MKSKNQQWAISLSVVVREAPEVMQILKAIAMCYWLYARISLEDYR